MALPNQQTVEYPSFKLVIVGDGGPDTEGGFSKLGERRGTSSLDAQGRSVSRFSTAAVSEELITPPVHMNCQIKQNYILSRLGRAAYEC
ncbi:hypothetical protein ABKV19_022681 [Rosa sericea]